MSDTAPQAAPASDSAKLLPKPPRLTPPLTDLQRDVLLLDMRDAFHTTINLLLTLNNTNRKLLEAVEPPEAEEGEERPNPFLALQEAVETQTAAVETWNRTMETLPDMLSGRVAGDVQRLVAEALIPDDTAG